MAIHDVSLEQCNVCMMEMEAVNHNTVASWEEKEMERKKKSKKNSSNTIR